MTQIVRLIGTALLLVCLASAGYLATSTSSQETAVIGLFSSKTETQELDGPKSVAQMVPRARPDIYYEAITDRPLFAQTRRPTALTSEIVVEDEAPEPIIEAEPELEEIIPEPNLVLLGVLAGGARQSALISLDGADPKWVREGSQVAGWLLKAIKANSIELSEQDRSLTIELYRK